jgi:2-phospho-L-lactate guanylyltransferase
MHDSSAPWLLIPVKSLSQGKQRLKPSLSDRDRALLNEFFLVRMLDTAKQFPGLERTAVVSGDSDVTKIVESYGGRTIWSDGLNLNQALTEGRRLLLREQDKSLLVLPVDVPLVEPTDVEELSRLGQRHLIIICPDRDRMGTNAIFFAKGATIPFLFGTDSFLSHSAEARRCCGRNFHVYLNDHFAFDIDTPSDLKMMISSHFDFETEGRGTARKGAASHRLRDRHEVYKLFS